jgi:preprotein translocase subunit SecB
MKTQPEKFSVDKKAAISLTNFQIVNTRFEVSEDKWGDQKVSNDCSLSISFRALTKEEDTALFALHFEVELINESKSFSLSIEAFAEFHTIDVKVDEDFIKTSLVTGNAPAIVFPYLRTFITSFCQNSGFNPIILPGFNFNQVTPIEE